MANWKMTATSIYCDAIDDEVTLVVYRDGESQCTGYNKFDKPDREISKALGIKSKQLGKQLRCDGLQCHRLLQYRDKVLAGKSKEGRESAGSE